MDRKLSGSPMSGRGEEGPHREEWGYQRRGESATLNTHIHITQLQIPSACLPLRSRSNSPGLESGSVPSWPTEYGGSDAVEVRNRQLPSLLECSLLEASRIVTRKFVGKPLKGRSKVWGPHAQLSSQSIARSKRPVMWGSHVSRSSSCSQPGPANRQAFPAEPCQSYMFVDWLVLFF